MVSNMKNGLQNYDPNIMWGTHTVEVTLQKWGYTGTLSYETRGNCKGFAVLDGCIDDLMYQLLEDDDQELIRLTLAKPNGGDTLTCEIWDERDLESMIVGVRIIGFQPEKR
jgi:hypothetical protein